jgi:hypothetical protein
MRNQICRILIYGLLSLCIFATSTPYPTHEVYAEDAQSWDSASCTKMDYWMQEFSASAEPQRIKIGQDFSQDAIVYEFSQVGDIYGLTISADIEINGDRSLVRVILVDDEMHEYLVYEAYPLIVDAKNISVNDVCEETCLLKAKKPRLLKVQIIDASISIKEISTLPPPLKLHEDVTSLRKQIKKAQGSAKINKLTSQRHKKKIKWNTGETSISKLSYEEKRKIFVGGRVPNLQGAENAEHWQQTES